MLSKFLYPETSEIIWLLFRICWIQYLVTVTLGFQQQSLILSALLLPNKKNFIAIS